MAMLCVLTIALFITSDLDAWAQRSVDRAPVAQLQVERAALEIRLNRYNEAEAQAKDAVQQSQSAYALASRLQDTQAIPIAKEALRMAQMTLDRIRRAQSDDKKSGSRCWAV